MRKSAMSIQVRVPDLGDGIESGDVLEILVREGDQIKKDQGIVELETDKATVEVPSSHAGKVSKIHIKSGQSVAVGDVLISLESEAGAERRLPRPSPRRLPPSRARCSQARAGSACQGRRTQTAARRAGATARRGRKANTIRPAGRYRRGDVRFPRTSRQSRHPARRHHGGWSRHRRQPGGAAIRTRGRRGPAPGPRQRTRRTYQS